MAHCLAHLLQYKFLINVIFNIYVFKRLSCFNVYSAFHIKRRNRPEMEFTDDSLLDPVEWCAGDLTGFGWWTRGGVQSWS